jgi:hypothetical protein
MVVIFLRPVIWIETGKSLDKIKFVRFLFWRHSDLLTKIK